MNVLLWETADTKIAEIIEPPMLIRTAQDALDLMMDPELKGAQKIILQQKHFVAECFDLRTGLLGDIVQKFVNYHVQLAIVGDFESDASEALEAFVRESNQGRHLLFAATTDEARKKLASL